MVPWFSGREDSTVLNSLGLYYLVIDVLYFTLKQHFYFVKIEKLNNLEWKSTYPYGIVFVSSYFTFVIIYAIRSTTDIGHSGY